MVPRVTRRNDVSTGSAVFCTVHGHTQTRKQTDYATCDICSYSTHLRYAEQLAVKLCTAGSSNTLHETVDHGYLTSFQVLLGRVETETAQCEVGTFVTFCRVFIPVSMGRLHPLRNITLELLSKIEARSCGSRCVITSSNHSKAIRTAR